MDAQSDVLVLIYYRFRGQLQPIRNILCYLRLPFVEIHLQFIEEQRKQISASILDKLRGLKIDRLKLPLLVHDDLLIYQAFSIMNYLCRISMREDLLGANIFQKARVLETLQIYYCKQPQSMVQLFRVSDLAANSTEQFINSSLTSSFESIMNSSGYIRQICRYIEQRKNPQYIFNNITVIDFLYLETCIYMLGTYGKLDQMPQSQNKEKKLQKGNYKYLSTMRDYKNRMQNQAFYIENQEYLQNFSIISTMTSQQRVKGLRNIWLGNPQLIK